MADKTIYRVQNQQERFAVMDQTNRVIVVCRDNASADQYALLLSEAFLNGFKAGYREAKALAKKPVKS